MRTYLIAIFLTIIETGPTPAQEQAMQNMTAFLTTPAAGASGSGGRQAGYVEIVQADIESDRILITLGPANSGTAQLEVVGMREADSSELIFSGFMSPGVEQVISFNAADLARGRYSAVKATWNGGIDRAAVRFDVLGHWRHSQYNTPHEVSCNKPKVPAYITNVHCDWISTELKSDFIKQLRLNGNGITIDHGAVQNEDYCFKGQAPIGWQPDPSESFRRQSIRTASGGPLNNTTVAQGKDGPFRWGERILIVSDDGMVVVKTVTDLCPACNDRQLDNYTTNPACRPGDIRDLGHFQTIHLR
ncbi:MAG: hypothetical protein OXQ89_02295 [Rhodospirillaceae bacterium]|nr:hypothetical protein [Rhodospirillaceae bacterium]